MEDNVRNWLKSFGLQDYAKIFEEYGWEILDDLFDIDADNLTICMPKPGHRKRFELALQKTKNTGMRYPVKTDDEMNIDNNSPDDGASYDPNANAVAIWLQRHGLEQYVLKFEDEGWDMLEVITHMAEHDIQKCIDKPGHRVKFQIALEKHGIEKGYGHNASALPDSAEVKHVVESWLKENNLHQYIAKFNDDGWDTFECLIELGRHEEDLKRCIDKPGHRVRFQRALERERLPENRVQTEVSKLQSDTTTIQKETERDIVGENNAYLENDSHDLKTVHKHEERFKLEEGDSHDTGNKADERQSVARTETEETVKKETIYRKDKPPLGQATLKEEPVKFGLSFEENETQSTIDPVLREKDTSGVDLSEDENPETDSDDDYAVKTVEIESKGLQRTYSLPPIPSQMFIKNANVAVGGHILTRTSKTFSPDAKRKYRDNFKKQMKTALDVSKKKDSLFVETKAYRELEERVKTTHWGVVIGIPGDGKTSMADHLALKYNRKGYDYLELHFARDWKDWVDGSSGGENGKNQFILIDDIFGRMSIDERKVSDWISIIDLMQKVVQQRQGKLKVVCTSRKYVFEDLKTKLAQFACFQEPSIIDITQSAFALTKVEESQIWKAYENKFGPITMPCTLSGDEKEESPPHGFPHCVDLYFSRPSLQKEDDFFENPMECICRELDYFKDNDKTKYFALLQVLFHNNKLTDVCLEDMAANHQEFKSRASAAGIKSCPTGTDLKKALDAFKGTYITELDGCYSISHDSIRENLAFVFIKQNPVYAIGNMYFDYLTDHTRCKDQTTSDNPHSRLMYTLSPQCKTLLVKRMLEEIRRGNVVTVCAHQAWDDTAFVEEWIQCLNKLIERDNEDQHGYARIADVFNTKDSSTSYIFDFSLFDALRFFGHKEAVRQIAQSNIGTLLDEAQGQTETLKDMDFEKPLSLSLHRIMDKIGASQDLRKFQIHSAISMELLDTVCAYIADEKFRCYIFGSHSEGTRIITHIPKRDCDVNYLFCLKNSEVVQSLSEIKPEQDIQYMLAVTDAITRPGYVKLQFVHNGVPETKASFGRKLTYKDRTLDHQDRVVLCTRRPDKIHVDEVKGLIATTDMVTAKTHAPTDTANTPAGRDYEIYHSYRCRSWPKIATKWISRIRHHNWPSRSIIEQIKSLGVFLVPVGSQGSYEKSLEWKILFLLQERMLISTLNDTQYKCYIILKMINNDIISRRFDEPVLVTYHLKTCLFYVIENTPKSLWQTERLLDCLQICLKRILQCVTEGNCPNYFIPQDNLFYRSIRGEVQTKLTNVLQTILDSNIRFWYLLFLKCGNLGPRLEQEICSKTDTIQRDRDLVPSPVRLYLKLIKFLSLVKMRILCKCYHTDSKECVRLHFEEAVKELIRADEVIDHTKEQTVDAFFLVLPYVELSLMSVLVARELEMSNDMEELLPLLRSRKWREIGLSIPSRLKQALFLHMCGQIDASQRVLRSLEQSMKPDMISVCGCQYHHTIVDPETTERIKDMPEPEFRKNMCVSCVAFLPTEEKIIPCVLGYEMRRAKVTTASDTAIFHFWYNWAVVDGKVLRHLIMYLNYRAVGGENSSTLFASVPADIRRKKDNVIRELQDTINDDPNLGHKETGLNILGWIYRQEGDEDKAERCFRESLEIQPAYNAANLHMEELVFYGQ